MMQVHTCRQCRQSFAGGPRASYCPTCRQDRQRETQRTFKSRKQAGRSRPLGSTDLCEQCSKPYIVAGGLQRFCLDCRLTHAREYDRTTAMAFYYAHRMQINAQRRLKRRLRVRQCRQCGSPLPWNLRPIQYCSTTCRRLRINARWRVRYHQKKKAMLSDASLSASEDEPALTRGVSRPRDDFDDPKEAWL